MEPDPNSFSIQKLHFNPTQIAKFSFLVTLVFSVFLSSKGFCAEVDSLTAKNVAKNFYVSRLPHLKAAIQELPISLVHAERFIEYDTVPINKGRIIIPLYYVFNVGNNQGYIIVSADDRVPPVLGYSLSGSYQEENQPPARKMWMRGYKEKIIHAITEDYQPEEKVLNDWETFQDENKLKSASAVNEVRPLLGLMRWDQGCDYNRECPEDSRGPCDRTYAGCVATAMGQIMKYWNHPYSCNDIPEYNDQINENENGDPIPDSNYGRIPGITSTVYNWSNMPDVFDSFSPESSKDEISRLLKHCGVSVRMNYGPYGSSASAFRARDAFMNLFSYATTASLIWRDYFTSDWVAEIRSELDNFRPVLYVGTSCDTCSGHAFVCDGYRDTEYFHFNWGWDGSYNNEEYMYLYDITPGPYNFSEEQGAIIGIMPDYMDPCSNIISIDECNMPYSFAGGGRGSWSGNLCSLPTPGREQMYRFVAPVTGNYSIEVIEANGWVDYGWKTSSCSENDWHCIGDIRSPGTYGSESMSWTAGTEYYILLDDEDAISGIHQFLINCPDLPELEYSSHNIDDDNSTSSGNNNGYVNAGESIELTITLRNNGAGNAHNVWAVLSTSNPYITVTDMNEHYGDISVGSTAATAEDYDFYVDPNCPEGYVTFNLEISSNEGNWTDQFEVYVYPAPEIDPCDNVTPIPGLGSLYTRTYSGGGNGSWFTTTANDCGITTPGIEGLYSFEAPFTGPFFIEVTEANGTVAYSYKSGSCSSTGWTCVEIVNSPGMLRQLELIGGVTYYILLDDVNSTAGTHEFHIDYVETNPELEHNSHSIDDDNINSSSGNGNGYIDAGETIEMPVTLINTGDEDAHNVSAVLSTTNPYISILDANENYNTISAGSTAASADDYDFYVASNCPQGWVTFTLNISSDEGDWTDEFTVYIYAAPQTNPCDNIISIDDCGSSYSFAGGDGGSWSNSMCGYATPGREQVYSFIPPLTGYYSIAVTSANGAMDYGWRSSACSEGGWTCIAHVESPNYYGNMYWTAGTTYYILLDDANTADGIHEFHISCPFVQLQWGGLLEIDDDNSTSSGNNNQRIDAGETIELSLDVYNIGDADAHNVTALLATDNPYITITDANENFGDISAGSSAASLEDYDFIVDPDCPDGPVTFFLSIQSDEGTWVDQFDMYAYGALQTNPCENIIPINGCNSVYTFAGGGNGAWNNNMCDYSTPGREQIYSFIAPETGIYQLEVLTADGYMDYGWRSSSCSETGWNCISDVGYPDTYGGMSWTGGTTYYILVDDEDETEGIHQFYISCPNSGCEDSYEANNTLSNANTSAFSVLGSSIYTRSINGTIHDANDEDFYRLNLTVAGTVIINLPNPPANYDLELLNAAGQRVDFSTTSGSESVSFECMGNETGYYYIHVYGYQGANSCTQYELNLQWDNYFLEVTPPSRLVDHTGGSTYFDVSTNVAWNISEGANWLEATEASFSRMDVNYDANTTTNQRTAYITVTAYGGLSETVTVVQQTENPTGCEDSYEANNTLSNANTSAFSVLGSSIYTRSINGTIHDANDEDFYRLNLTVAGTVIVNLPNPPANYDLELLNAAGQRVDFSTTSGSESVSFECMGNETGYYYIHVYGYQGANSCTQYELNLQWDNYFLEVTPPSRLVDHTGGSTYFDVSTNVAWNISEGANWLEATEASFSRMEVNYDANTTTDQRTAYITVTAYGGLSETVTVVQQTENPTGCEDSYEANNTLSNANTSAFSVLGSSIYTRSINGTIHDANDEDFYRLNLTVAGTVIINLPNPPANYDLELLNAAGQRVDFSTTSGSESVSFECMGNETGYYYIHVYGYQGANSCTQYELNLQWDHYFLEVTPPSRLVDHTDGSTYFDVSTNVAWNISEGANWLEATEASFSRMEVNYDANTTTDQRTAYITVTAYGGLSETVTVTQQGVSVEQPNLTYNSNYNSLNVNGTLVNLSNRLENVGEATAGESYIAYYLSSDAVVAASDFPIGENLVPTLQAGEYRDNTFEIDVLDANPSIPNGTYYVGYIIDVYNDVDETSDADNVFVFNSATISIAQATYVEVSPGNRAVGSDAGTVDFSVNTDGGWSVTANDTWLTATKINETTFSVTFSSNTTSDLRTAIITVTGVGGLTANATLTQSPEYKYPNLLPYRPSEWDDAIVASSVKGTNINTEIFEGEVTYLDFAWINNGIGDAWSHTSCIFLDNQSINCITIGGLSTGNNYQYEDFEYTFTESGWHTLKIHVDLHDNVPEENDRDNEYERQLYISPPTGIEYNVVLDSIHIYPNPTGGRFFLEIYHARKDTYMLEIFDPTGKVLWIKQINNSNQVIRENIDISRNPAGMYFLKVTNNDRQRIKKIILKD
jgi:hypothetical protein